MPDKERQLNAKELEELQQMEKNIIQVERAIVQLETQKKLVLDEWKERFGRRERFFAKLIKRYKIDRKTEQLDVQTGKITPMNYGEQNQRTNNVQGGGNTV